MSLFSRWFSFGTALGAAEKVRLNAWRRLPEGRLDTDFTESRYVVVDVETTGLNLSRDKLIAIGAVAVDKGCIRLADSFEIILQQQVSSDKDNILIHGIGGTAQTGGIPPVEALLRFLEFLGKDPLVAFHVTFDKTMIRRAIREFLGHRFNHPWLDLAYVAPGLNPQHAHVHRTLDEWTRHFGIQNYARHNALADALTTAQLYQVVIEQGRQKNIKAFNGLQDVEKLHRWSRGTG